MFAPTLSIGAAIAPSQHILSKGPVSSIRNMADTYKCSVCEGIYPISINTYGVVRYVVPPRPDKREIPLYIREGDKVERIYRVLLSKRGVARTWYRIAKDADVSYGWAHHILEGLEREGLIAGSEVVGTRELFLKWADRRDRRLFREYNVQEPDEIIAGSKLDHAYTGYFAENRLGQYLFPRFREFYVKMDDRMRWHQLLTRHGYVGRGNTQVLLADAHVFFERQNVDGYPLVSTQQLIADLYRTGAECAEAADLLVSKVYL